MSVHGVTGVKLGYILSTLFINEPPIYMKKCQTSLII